MKQGTKILLFTQDPSLEKTLRGSLEAGKNPATIEAFRDLNSLTARIEKGSAPLVLVDIDPESGKLLDEVEVLLNHHPAVRSIVITAQLNSELLVRAMQAGVRHVQQRNAVEEELSEVLDRLTATISADTGPARDGSAITILSAGGGAGCTTLAVNLANELQLKSSESVLIADLDYAYGAVGSYLELSGQYGIADVLDYEGCIDKELIHTTSVPYTDSMRALLSPVSVDFGTTRPLVADRIGETISACKHGSRYTVFDAPRVSIEVAATLAHGSEATLIVMQAAVKDIHVTRNLMSALTERGVQIERIKPILNRYRKRGAMITLEEARKALGGISPVCLSNDYTSALHGVNYGKLLASAAPRSPLRKDLIQLASDFSGLEAMDNKNGRHEPVMVRSLQPAHQESL